MAIVSERVARCGNFRRKGREEGQQLGRGQGGVETVDEREGRKVNISALRKKMAQCFESKPSFESI